MHDLAAFIRARLDEDEQAARAVERPHWDTHDTHVDTGGHCAVVLGRNPDDQWDSKLVAWLPTFTFPGWDVPGPWASARHIARHDPARVLREVKAKRRIVDAAVATWNASCDPAGDFWVGLAPTQTATLRLLASCRSDHPDYRPEWA